MKKAITFLLALLLYLTTFAGCNTPQTPDDSNPPEPSKDVIDDYDNENEIEVEIGGDNENNENNENKPNDEGKDPDKQPVTGPEHTNTIGKFVAKDKKYVYEGANVTILHLENQSDEYFTITIYGEYLDENGEVLKTETQTFEGFPGLWQNYFVFKPDIVYDDFRYTLSAIKYSGEKLLHTTSNVQFSRLFEDRVIHMELYENDKDPTRYPTISTEFRLLGMPKNLIMQFWLITFDNQGEIYHLYRLRKRVTLDESTVQHPLLQTTDNKIVWPEKLNGGVTGIGGVYCIENE